MRPDDAGTLAAGPPSPGDETRQDDFRVRAAAQKRDRMRARLIDATLDAFVDAQPGRVPVIDDVIRVAEVSRGTFYKYFDALDDVLGEIGRRMASEMLSSHEQVFADVADSGVRVAAGPLMAMARAVMEPRHAVLVSRVDFIDFLGGGDPRSRIVARSLVEGRDCGTLKFESLDAAVDLIVGTSVEAARRVLKTRVADAAYVREVATLLLIALGVTRSKAGRAVDAAWRHLEAHRAELPWWKPLSDG